MGQDNRRIQSDVAAMSKQWEELNAEAAKDPELARMHRDGHCHEAVMWYVHHLPESVRAELKDKAELPLLSNFRHNVLESKLSLTLFALEKFSMLPQQITKHRPFFLESSS